MSFPARRYRWMALAAVCLAAGAGAWFVIVAGQGYEGDGFGGVRFHPFTQDPGNEGCIPAAHFEGQRDCDPVNVLWPGWTVPEVVTSLRATGWGTGTGSLQTLAFYDGTWTSVPFDAQLTSGSLVSRHHVRLWQAPGPGLLVIGAVHHESGIPHSIDRDWDEAEGFLAGQVCGGGCTTLVLGAQLDHQAGLTWRGWGNDGIAVVVLGSPPPVTPTPEPSSTPQPSATPTTSPGPGPTGTPSPTVTPTATATPESTVSPGPATPTASPTSTVAPAAPRAPALARD